MGASSIVFGFFGVHLALFVFRKKAYERIIGTEIIVLLVINIVISFIDSGIDLYGHLGGLIGGFAMGVVFYC